MGSTSFFGFSYPNLLLVFLNLLFFRDLYHILLASVGTLSGSFLFYRYFSVPYFGLLIVTTEIRFHTSQYYCNPKLQIYCTSVLISF